MSIADLIPHLLATRMEPRVPEQQPLSEKERKSANRKKNAYRAQWRAKRRAQGLAVT